MHAGTKNTFYKRFLRLNLVVVVCLILAHNGSLMAQDAEPPSHTLDPVVVTASRTPEHLSKTGKSVSIITREDIEALPVNSIPELLETISGVDVRQRGVHGVQADVSIRGSSFEQTLILVDGVNVNDAQTGHHNLDLPINLEDIERIEVVKGPASRIYGHNALAGVINIITREADHSTVGGYAKYGDYDYCDVGAHGVVSTGNISNRASASRRSSTGHIEKENTDFDINSFSYKGTVNRQNQKITVSLGYSDKEFGAYRFYSDTFPNQREKTETLLAYTSAHLKMEDLEVMPRVFWRRHDDDFKIEIQDHWYRNEHQTDARGVQLDSRFTSELGTTAVSGEITFEDLESSNLGDHNRQRSGIFLEHRFYPFQELTFSVGASAVHYSHWGWELWPGGEFSAELSDGLNWFGSIERSFRIPTYTELYYYTPANKGNPDLKPEQAWAYETGIRWQDKGVGANFSVFRRDENDLIDWSRASKQEPWKARNVAENTTQGLEIGFDLYPDAFWGKKLVSAVNMAYTYLDSDWDSGELDSKYVLDHLRHQLVASIILDWFDTLTQAVIVRYEERMFGDSHVVVDTRFAYKSHRYEVFLDVANLFDEQYVESGFSPMPGRWVIGGVKLYVDFWQ
jgi:iron complex outermembrane receptor protein